MSESNFTTTLRDVFNVVRQSLKGEEMDYTKGSIRRSVILLAIPMMFEMIMESVFALVDLYFVGHLEDSSHALQIVGLTESFLTIIYSLAIGMSMAATAVVARRIGEKNPEAAARAGVQAIIISIAITIVLSIVGFIKAKELLLILGASETSAIKGTAFMQIMMSGSIFIMLLFLINGIFRGAGNAAIAMKSLWLANIINIILCPIFINGLWFIPAMGLTGAAIATTIGRSIGVLYQLYHLFSGKHTLKVRLSHWLPDWPQIGSLVKIASPGILQFVIASCSWIFLAKLVAETGGDARSAGYQTALRLMMVFMLPAWGLSNAAATLVGQNLGAKQVERAEKSVAITIRYNVIFMAIVTALFLTCGEFFISFFTTDMAVINVARQSLNVICLGYVFYGVGMVMMNAFNGAGDTVTPTWINFIGFWLFQIPFAYFLARTCDMGPMGVFISIPVSETLITIASFILFKRGKWKEIKV
ncbi:MAG: MATE family efflux transporter [Saprospiraceae bacterium]|nr:MATE family efflux transporter [Candidatus Brachybacter algidus]